MREIYEIETIELGDIARKMLHRQRDGCRLVQICAVNAKDGWDLLYSVADKNNKFINYKVHVKEGQKVVSMTDIFPAAMLYENEIKELFGVQIDCISLDYNNRLYRIDKETPFREKSKDKEDKN